MMFELDDELADCECDNCARNLKNPNHQGTAISRDDPIVAFRCYYCGRLFCNDCAEDHFEPRDNE